MKLENIEERVLSGGVVLCSAAVQGPAWWLAPGA